MSLSGLCTSFSKVTLFSLPEVFCGPQICQNSLADHAEGAHDDTERRKDILAALFPRLYSSIGPKSVYSATPLAFNPLDGAVPRDDLKIFTERLDSQGTQETHQEMR